MQSDVITKYLYYVLCGTDSFLEKERLFSLTLLSRERKIQDAMIMSNRVLYNVFFEYILRKASADTLHIAVATVHRVDFLVTWNCKHIANAEIMGNLRLAADLIGYKLPQICTPEELMGGK
jgi:hypothetical protein